MGTCYLARSPMGCFLEVFREWILIPEPEVTARRVSELGLPYDVNLADCTASRARSFGLTAEIHSTPDYGVTQAWAAAFAEAGFHGVHYYLRHDPGQQLHGLALFGPAGVGPSTSGYLPGSPKPIGPEILREADARFGLTVVPIS